MHAEEKVVLLRPARAVMSALLDNAQASKRQKSSGLGSEPPSHKSLRELFASLDKAINAAKSDGIHPPQHSAAALLAQSAEACLSNGENGSYCRIILSSMLTKLEEESRKLQAGLDLHSLPDVPEYCRAEAIVSNARRAATYAHKLSYTTFAPPVVLGQNLFRPPAPQDFDFRASCLHTLTRELVVEPTTAAGISPAVAADSAALQPTEQAPIQASATPLLESLTTASPSAPELTTEPAAPPEATKKQEAVNLTSSAFDFILNPNVEEVDEEFSSSEAESE